MEDAGNGAGWELLDGSDSIYVTASRKQIKARPFTPPLEVTRSQLPDALEMFPQELFIALGDISCVLHLFKASSRRGKVRR